MKERKKIKLILSTFCLEKPVPRQIRKKILVSKERSFDLIVEKGLGETSIIDMDKYSLKRPKKHDTSIGGIMKKVAVVGGMVAVIAIAAGVYFYTHESGKKFIAGNENGVVEKAIVTFVLGDAKVKRGAAAVPIAIGDKIGKNDVITTGEKSNVTMQISNTGVVRVLEKSEFTFSALKEKGATELALSKGSVFSKVIKIEKGNSYKVKTPLCIAAVRGTEFLSTYENEKSEVQVLGGKVAVNSIDEKTEKIANGENGVKVDGAGMALTEYKLNRIQTTTLEKYAQADYIENIEEKTPDQLKTIGEDVLIREKKLNDKIKQIMQEERINPLDKLRSMGKPLTMLYLRDGSQIAGSILSSNEKSISLDTGEGVISVPTDEVRRRMVIK